MEQALRKLRDRISGWTAALRARFSRNPAARAEKEATPPAPKTPIRLIEIDAYIAVSYTHLTLPTICSV